MDEEKTVFGLNPEKLIRFLTLGAEEDRSELSDDTEQSKADLLRDRLRNPLPLDPEVVERMPTILRRFYHEFLTLSGESLGDLLTDHKTDIHTIIKIKEYAKMLSISANSKSENETAVVIYYLAIAHALMIHKHKITDYSYKELDQSYSVMIAREWMIPEVRKMFLEARRICQQLKNSDTGTNTQ